VEFRLVNRILAARNVLEVLARGKEMDSMTFGGSHQNSNYQPLKTRGLVMAKVVTNADVIHGYPQATICSEEPPHTAEELGSLCKIIKLLLVHEVVTISQ
jgi:hypothetical protein